MWKNASEELVRYRTEYYAHLRDWYGEENDDDLWSNSLSLEVE